MAVKVQLGAFDAGEEVRALLGRRADVGAVVTFTGLVRDQAHGRALSSMTLEHYPGMTEAELERLDAAARARFDILDCLILHRFGELLPGDEIVLVVVLGQHRAAAFEAAEFVMDFLKSRAPFWKKETGTDGAGSWVDARDSDESALSRWEHLE